MSNGMLSGRIMSKRVAMANTKPKSETMSSRHSPIVHRIYRLNNQVNFCADLFVVHELSSLLHSVMTINNGECLKLNKKSVKMFTETHFITRISIFSEDVFTFVYEDFPIKNNTFWMNKKENVLD